MPEIDLFANIPSVEPDTKNLLEDIPSTEEAPVVNPLLHGIPKFKTTVVSSTDGFVNADATELLNKEIENAVAHDGFGTGQVGVGRGFDESLAGKIMQRANILSAEEEDSNLGFAPEPPPAKKTDKELRKEAIAVNSGFVPEVDDKPSIASDAEIASSYVDYKKDQLASESSSQFEYEKKLRAAGIPTHGTVIPDFIRYGVNESITGKISGIIDGSDLFDMRAFDPADLTEIEEIGAALIGIAMPVDQIAFGVGGALGKSMSVAAAKMVSKGIPAHIANKTIISSANKAIQRYIDYGIANQTGITFATYDGLNAAVDQLELMQSGAGFDFATVGDEVLHGYGTGVLTGTFGVLGSRVQSGSRTKAKTSKRPTLKDEIAYVGGEIFGMAVASPILLEGRMPTVDDITSATGMLGGLRLSKSIKKKINPTESEQLIRDMRERVSRTRSELGVDAETARLIVGAELKTEASRDALLASSKDAFESYQNFDGSTFSASEGNLAERTNIEGRPIYSVSLWPERTKVIDGKKATRDDFNNFILENQDVLGSSDRNVMGSWYDKASGKTFLDISTVTNNANTASYFGLRYNQKSMMNLTSLTEYGTGGTGESIIPRDALNARDRHLEVDAYEANKANLPFTTVEAFHYSKEQYPIVSGHEAKEAGTLGRTGGEETRRDGPPKTFFYGKGSNIENVHEIGNANDFVHKFNGNINLWNRETATDVELKNFRDKKQEIGKRDRISDTNQLNDMALNELGYDGFVVKRGDDVVYGMFTPLQVESNRILETAQKAGEGFSGGKKAEMNADFIPHLDSGLAPLKDRARDVVIASERKRAVETAIANKKSSKWKGQHSETELEDIGASIEGIDNIRTGKKNADIEAEMTPEMRKTKDEIVLSNELSRRGVNDYLREFQYDGQDYIQYIEQYLGHFYTGEDKKIKLATRRFLKNSPNAKKRKLPTLQDAVNAGLTPMTQNAATLYSMWNDINWRVAANVRTVNELNNMVSDDGTPIIMRPQDAPPEWPIIQSPLFGKLSAKKSGSKTILYEGGAAVNPEIAHVIEKITQRPFDNTFVRSIEGINRWAKTASLLFSGFHFLSLAESASATLMRGHNPVRGMFIVGEKDPITGKRIAVERPHRRGVRLLEQDDFLRDAIGHGLTIESVRDVQVAKIERDLIAIEGIASSSFGKSMIRGARNFKTSWDKVLWENYHSGLKATTYENLVSELSLKFPEMDRDLLKNQVASHVNDAYGGQEWGAKMWATPQAQQLLRIGMLAPDYTLSNIRVAGKTLLPSTSPLEKKMGARYWRNMVPTLALGPLAAQMAIYYMFGDDEKGDKPFIWENESGKKLDIDVTPVMRKFSTDKDDNQRYYTHLGKQAREIVGWPKDWVGTLYGKSAPIVQIGVEQVFGVNGPSGFEQPHALINFWDRFPENASKEIIARGKSIGEKFVPFAWRGNNFAMTAPMSRGISAYQTIGGYERILDMYANPVVFSEGKSPNFIDALDRIAPDVTDAALRNGHDVEKLFNSALNRRRSYYYGKLFESLEDEKATDDHLKYTKAIIRLHGGAENIYRSAKNRGVDFGGDQEMLETFMTSYKLAVEEVKDE